MNNEKAFPSIGSLIKDRNSDDYYTEGEEGMDLRDYFAAKATGADVNAFFAEASRKLEETGEMYSNSDAWILAKWMYADAMMEARR